MTSCCERVWGPKKLNDLWALRTHLRRLRRKLGEDREQPHLLLRRAARRLPDGQERGSGTEYRLTVTKKIMKRSATPIAFDLLS